MYCDSLQVQDGFAVAVLIDKPSDGHFDIPEDSEPIWEEGEDFCERCRRSAPSAGATPAKGRCCPDCERCACSPIPQTRCAQAAVLLARHAQPRSTA